MMNTGFNTEHILVGKWRNDRPLSEWEQETGYILRDAYDIAFACGLTDTLNNAYLYTAMPQNRMLCRYCASAYGSEFRSSIEEVDWHQFHDGRTYAPSLIVN